MILLFLLLKSSKDTYFYHYDFDKEFSSNSEFNLHSFFMFIDNNPMLPLT